MKIIIKIFVVAIVTCYILIIAGCSTSTRIAEKQSTQTEYISTERQNLKDHNDETPSIVWYPRPHNYNFSKAELVGGGDITFIDPMNGWKLQSLGGGNGYHAVDIFRTKDGGDSWVKIASANAENPTPDINGKPAPGTLPYYGSKIYIDFLDADTGWVTGSFAEGEGKVSKPWIYVTHDGGYTWDVQMLTQPSSINITLNTSIKTRSPWFFTPIDGILQMNVENGDAKYEFLYFTHDGGKEWGTPHEIDILNPSSSSGKSGGLNWDFSNSSNIKVSIGKDSWHSIDGGYTWLKK